MEPVVIKQILNMPTHILVHALLFVCILALRDVIKQTMQSLNLPAHTLLWAWLSAGFQILMALLVLTVLASIGLVDPLRFTMG
jgi:hypothetical protein